MCKVVDWILCSDVTLVWTQILISLGGAFSVVGSRVATQASVPHQDMATVIALLALWTKIGGAIGSAVATAIWKYVTTVHPIARSCGPTEFVQRQDANELEQIPKR